MEDICILSMYLERKTLVLQVNSRQVNDREKKRRVEKQLKNQVMFEHKELSQQDVNQIKENRLNAPKPQHGLWQLHDWLTKKKTATEKLSGKRMLPRCFFIYIYIIVTLFLFIQLVQYWNACQHGSANLFQRVLKSKVKDMSKLPMQALQHIFFSGSKTYSS